MYHIRIVSYPVKSYVQNLNCASEIPETWVAKVTHILSVQNFMHYFRKYLCCIRNRNFKIAALFIPILVLVNFVLGMTLIFLYKMRHL